MPQTNMIHHPVIIYGHWANQSCSIPLKLNIKGAKPLNIMSFYYRKRCLFIKTSQKVKNFLLIPYLEHAHK